MKLEQEIQESIKKNLPSQVGDVLKAKLEQADRDAETVKNQEEAIKDFKREIQELQETVREYSKFDERNSKLNQREKELNQISINQEVERLKYQLDAEKEKTEFTKSVAMGIVRNTEYRKTIFDSENPGGHPVIDGNGNYHYPVPTSKAYSETKVEE